MAALSRKIALTEIELDELLSSCSIMRIASHGPGARINLTPMWFAWQGHAIYTWCRGQKLTNMRRNPDVTVLVDRGDQFNDLQGVMIHGNATVLEDAAAEDADAGLTAVRAGMGAKYSARREGARGSPQTNTAAASATRRWVRIDPVATVSWDNTKLARVRGEAPS
jgi:nitroimidazol reductase NimA-like FMN-containing flavoprotein (pyridoxamine 5'-phosphate oxidase superfamily)